MQSRMFVEYLLSRDTDAFTEFVAAVVRGAEFESAFNKNFREGLPDVWKDFIEFLEAGPQ